MRPGRAVAKRERTHEENTRGGPPGPAFSGNGTAEGLGNRVLLRPEGMLQRQDLRERLAAALLRAVLCAVLAVPALRRLWPPWPCVLRLPRSDPRPVVSLLALRRRQPGRPGLRKLDAGEPLPDAGP